MFRSKSKGVILIEVAFTLPILCYLIFFLLELIKINTTQSALDAIAAEATYDYIASETIANFEKIIDKFRPQFIPKDRVRYWFRFYNDLATMCANSPYGGEEIAYPDYTDPNAAGHAEVGNGNSIDFIDTDGSKTHLRAVGFDDNYANVIKYTTGELLASGKAFVLTFVIDYPFSSSFVKMLFSGGSNTIKSGQKGTKYLLWSRGIGIVN
ncbi:MAG: hypothetical protein LBF57_01775 [Holosporaceae bacterium]|jgi:hypothetical protein|nr:hypothetical protein [Holosporaceae bacterium]